MSSIKLEDEDEQPTKIINKGGRPHHEGWALYHFKRIDDNKRAIAQCMKCKSTMKNTSLARMEGHRKKCGKLEASSKMQMFVQSKNERDDNDGGNNQTSVLWTSQAEVTDYIDETDPVQVHRIEKANFSLLDVVQEDIKRHSKPSRERKRLSVSDTHEIDTALSGFLIGCKLTFDIIDTKYFKNLVQALNPDYKAPSSQQLTSRLLAHLNNSQTSNESLSKKKTLKRRRYSSSESDSD